LQLNGCKPLFFLSTSGVNLGVNQKIARQLNLLPPQAKREVSCLA